MKQNNTLSLSRIKLLIKWDLAMNKKKYFWECAGMFVAYSAFLWVILLGAGQTHDVTGFPPVAIFTVYLLFAMLAVFNLADPIKQKKTRLAYLTLPASNGEKFLCRVLIVTVFFSIASLGIFVLADVVQYVARMMIDWILPFVPNVVSYETPNQLVTPQIPLVFTGSFYTMVPLTMCLSILLIHAVALVGGFYRGRIVAIVLLLGSARFAFPFLDWLEDIDIEGGSTFLVNSVQICLIVFCWWLAYRLFRRSQIV